jgi:hypothetical protein
MKSMWLAASALVLSGCALLGIGTGDSSSGATSTTGGGTDGGAATGVSCGADPATGTTLCLGISLCPTVVIDSEVFPACGFHVHGNVLDVECVCGGLLCPLGVAATCDALTALLAMSNEGSVCSAAGGACTELTATTTASSSGGTGTCDTACRDECAGDPNCIVACGC